MTTKNLLLTKQEIEELEVVKKEHFLNPNAVRMSKSLGDAVGLENIGVHLITVEPNRETTEFHFHHYEEECVYVLSGQGMAIIGEEEYPIAAGDFIGYPCNQIAHTILNTGTENIVCLVVGERRAQDVTDYPRQHKRLYRNSGEWNLVKHEDILNTHR